MERTEILEKLAYRLGSLSLRVKMIYDSCIVHMAGCNINLLCDNILRVAMKNWSRRYKFQTVEEEKWNRRTNNSTQSVRKKMREEQHRKM